MDVVDVNLFGRVVEMKAMKISLFGKRVLIVQEAEDEMDTVVVCPYCGKHTTYGQTAMVCGIVYCPACEKVAVAEILTDREKDPQRYQTHDYQPYGIE